MSEIENQEVVEQPVEQPVEQNEAPKEEAVTPQKLSEEQLANIRNYLHNSLMTEYKKLVSVVLSLPFPEDAFKQGLLHLDTGMLWLKEAISFAPFVNKQPAPQVQTEAEQAPETVNNAVEEAVDAA